VRTRRDSLRTVEHDNHPGALEVGIICCEHLTQDYVGARAREKSLRSLAGRRDSFVNGTRWAISKNGNPTLKTPDGYRVAIFQRGNGFRVWIKAPNANDGEYGALTHKTEIQAKLAAFNYLEHLRQVRYNPFG